MHIIKYGYQKGISLIEVLITVLILGIGLLGVASLQVASISSNQEGFFYSQASFIADDLASRIRTSKISELMPGSELTHENYIANYAQAGVYTCDAAPANFCQTSYAGAEPSDSCSDGTDDLADVAAFDRWDICTIAQNTLPDGKVSVLSSGWRLSIIVDWAPISPRDDLGQKSNVNTNCVAVATITDATRNCVITEILP